MSRAKGLQAPDWVAAYLQRWYPYARKTPNGINGQDIENTPGVSFEIKTSPVWRSSALAQAKRNSNGNLPVVIYLPPGIGERQVGLAYMVLPVERGMRLLEEAGYAPEPGYRVPLENSREVEN